MQQNRLLPVKKRKRIPATSESDGENSSKTNEQLNNKKHSSDIEIMNLSTSITPKSSAPPPSHPNSTIDTGGKTDTNPPENTAQEPSTPLNQTTDQSPIQSNSLSQVLKENFKFLILKGPDFFSNHQALKKMVESAQNFLEEEPDEAIYQLELNEKSSQLKQSEESLDVELNTAATPVVEAMTQFIQSLLERELKFKLDQAIRAHTVRQEKKFDKKLSQVKSKPSTDSSLPPPPPPPPPSSSSSSLVTAEKIEHIENSLATLTATIDKSDATKVDRKLQDFKKSAQYQAEIQSKQIQQLQAQLKEMEQNHKTHLNQLEIKLIAMEANQPKKRLAENKSTEPPSAQSKSNSKPVSPENTRTTTGNSLKLNLSPKVSSTSTSTTTQPKPRHRSSSQSQTQPQPKPTHPSSSVGNSNHSTVNPPTRNNSIANHTRPHPIKIPNRQSAETNALSPRTSNTLPSTEPLPSDSPVNTNHQSLSHPVSAEAYNHICARLMKSTWLVDFTKSISTDMYKQFIHQDLTTHLDQLGLTPQRISDLVNLLNLLPDLDLNFLSTKPSSAPFTNTIPPPNHPTTHPLPQPPNHPTTHPLPQTPILIANNPIHPPASVPTNFNMVQNFSLAHLKDILGVIQVNAQYLTSRLDRFEIRIANAERIGIHENSNVLNLNKRLEYTEAQISQLANSKAASEELLALQTGMEARVVLAQREINDSLTALWEETTLKIQSLQHHTPRSTSLSLPGHPHTPSTTQNNVHQSCLSMAKVENHILDRLFVELSPFFTPPGSNDTAPKELKPKPLERPRRELEEGETSGDDNDEDTIKSFPTLGDRTTDSYSSKSENSSTRWKTLIGSLSAKYQEQPKSSDKTVLVHEHQHHQHHHHHHHHHQRVRLVMGVEESSRIDSLKVDKQVERAVMSQSAEQLALEQHHEELEALAQTSCPNPTIPSTSAQSSSISNPPAPANPSSHPTSA